MLINLKKNLSTYVGIMRFGSWQLWILYFALGSILFTVPQIDRFIPFSLSFVCATAGAFVLNQYFDREVDKSNNLKRNLPIASGDVSPKMAILVFSLLYILSLSFVLFTDSSLLPLFLVYIFLWIAYSTPPFSLKKRPIIDILTSGIGSGVVPFIIGLQVSHQLTLDFSSPTIIRRYQDVFLAAVPLFLVQCSGHILQAVGDYEPDLTENVTTFTVKYGKITSLRVSKLFLILTPILPLFYDFFNLSSTPVLHWYLMVFLGLFPCLLYLIWRLGDASKSRLKTLRTISQRVGTFALVAIWLYMFLIRINL
jgi:4-hydroxybenzoate polyprenyltransferase